MENAMTLYKAAKLVRHGITICPDEITVSSTGDDIPADLYSLIRWTLVGPEKEMQTEVRNRTVDRTALTLSQNIMYAAKTRRQVHYKPKKASDQFRTPHSRENPQVLGLALSVHHDTRNKILVDLLHAHNY